MKITMLILLMCSTCLMNAQSFNCDQFTINGISPNPANSNEHVINIQFNGNASDFIGYPYVSALFGANGDTIGTGNMFYFGQLGGTSQDYPVVLEANAVTSQFTAMFIFLNGNVEDTCYLSFPSTANLSESMQNTELFSIWPNPVENVLTIHCKQPQIDTTYFIYDATGRKLMTGPMNCGTTLVDLSNLAPGSYYLVSDAIPELTTPLIKK